MAEVSSNLMAFEFSYCIIRYNKSSILKLK